MSSARNQASRRLIRLTSTTLATAVAVLVLVLAGGGTAAGAGQGSRDGECPVRPFTHCSGQDFILADLGRADLRGADLRGADLNGAFLYGATLAGADLRGADLRGTTLTSANLDGAKLNAANLADADLRFARVDRRALRNAYICRTRLPGGPTGQNCGERAPDPTVPGSPSVSVAAATLAPAPGDGHGARPLPGPALVWAKGVSSSESRAVVSGRRSARMLSRAARATDRRRIRRRSRHRARPGTKIRVRVIGQGRVRSGKGRTGYRVVAGKGKLNCPGRCHARFPRHTTVRLKARPHPGYLVDRWKQAGHRCLSARRCAINTRRTRRLRVVVVFRKKSIDPVKPICPVPADRDTDGDGLPDCSELAGWKLTVTTPGDLSSGTTSAAVTVTSDPKVPDTDGDGIDDGDEFRFNSNPDRTDTDRDGLTDRSEIEKFRTLPNHADSDGDSMAPDGGQAHSRFFDGNEVRDLSTSPSLADTDGDGMSDLVEVLYESTNPRVADLPMVNLDAEPGISNPQLDLGYTIEESTGTEKESASTTQVSNSSETSSERSRETTNAHTFEMEVGGKCDVGTQAIGCSVEEKFTNSWTHSVTQGSRSGFSNTKETSSEYEKIAKTSSERKVTLGPTGCMQVVLTLRNSGPVAVSVGNIQVLAWTPDPDDPNGSRLLAALQPIQGQAISNDCPATAPGYGPVDLAPGSKTDIAFSQQLDSKRVLDYMAEPTPIAYELGPISMTGTDMIGKQVNFGGEVANKVSDRTASIEVNFGDGTIREYSVAANSPVADEDGGVRGITLDDALGAALANLDPEYTDTAPSAIKSLRNPETGDVVANKPDLADGEWDIFGDADGIGNDARDWRSIALKAGDAISLTYTRDSDRDRLPDGYENQAGTDPNNSDTDADGLDDHFEARVGWTVPFARGFQAEYRVYPSPLGCDADGDGSPDGPGSGTAADPCPTASLYAPERDRLTDPTLADTNEDGIVDGDQPLPDALRAVPAGGRMPIRLRTWGGEGEFGPNTAPTGIAIDQNQPVYDTDGRPSPIDSYVIQRTPAGYDDLVVEFTGNPRAEAPWRRVEALQLPTNAFRGSLPGVPQGVATGIAVGKGQVGTGDDAGPPVIVNYYTKADPGWMPPPGTPYTNVFTTFNGKTGRDASSDPQQNGVLHGRYGEGTCCFFTPYMFSNPPFSYGGGYLDTVDRNGIVIGHSFDRSPELNATTTGLGSTEPSSLPTQYFGNIYSEPDMTRRFGAKPPAQNAEDPAPGQITNPSGVAVDHANGRLYVADNIGRSPAGVYDDRGVLTRFDLASGAVQARISDDSGTLSGLQGIAVDPEGKYLYALSSTNGTMYKLSSSLAILGRLGAAGAGPFTKPVDVDVDGRNGIWVVDSATKLIHFYFYPFGR